MRRCEQMCSKNMVLRTTCQAMYVFVYGLRPAPQTAVH